MMTRDWPRTTDRAKAALAALLVQGALLYALASGLHVTFAQVRDDALTLIALAPVKPPPPPVPRPAAIKQGRKAGAAAPPNRRSKATEVTAPPPIITVTIPPPPVVTAPLPGPGADRSSGAAPVSGPGTGSGGQGAGLGSGGAGDGDGDGGGTPLRQIGGRISGKDYPQGPLRAGIGGTLWVRYVVGVKGRVDNCRVVRSSGNAELDETTCRLIMQRFRYRPRRDARGKPVPSVIVEDHTWEVDRDDRQATPDDAPP